MATLIEQVERMRTARDNLVRMRNRVELSAPPPEELPRRREWVAREALAHIDEMLIYWLGEIERILAGGGGGRGRSSPCRSGGPRPT
jgi:hypothetical protein